MSHLLLDKALIWWQARGIRFKFIISVLSLFVVGVVSLSVFFTKRTQILLDENLNQKLNLLENNFLVIARNSLFESSYTTLNTLIKLISKRDKEILHIVVMDKSSTILATSSEKEYPIFYRLGDPSLMKMLEKKDEQIFFDKSKNLLSKLKIIYDQQDFGEDGIGDTDFTIDDGFSDSDGGNSSLLEEENSNQSFEEEKEFEEESEDAELNEVFEQESDLGITNSLDPEIQGYIYVALTTKFLEAEINRLWLISLISLTLILSLGAFVAYIVGSGLAKPLAFLASKVREIAQGNLNTTIVKLERKDEIGQLVLDTEDMRLSIKSLTDNLEEKVEERTRQLQLAQNENEKILDTVKTGLFSIDSNLIIGSQYSKTTENIFQTKSLPNVNLFGILKPLLDSEKLRMTDKYLTILFNKSINNAFTYDLNPLRKVKVKFERDIFKYLEFYFERIYVDEHIVGIMIIVEDVTEAHLLNERLKENQKKLDSQMEQLIAILNTDTQSLGMFLRDTSEDVIELRNILKEKIFDQDHMAHIYRIVHSIKGNAALLNLSIISGVAHSGEEEIILMQKKESIISVDISNLNKLVGELDQTLKKTKELVIKLQNFKSGLAKYSDINLLMLESIAKTVDRLSKLMGKGVEFDYKKFDIKLLNDENRKLVKNILIQLIRNSVNHGLETYQERKELSKPLNGNIQLISERKDENFFTVILSDDGKGLNPDKLRNKAISLNKERYKDVALWSDEQLRELIFDPGFSTQEVANLTAGRGIGMDIIKKDTEALGGKLTIESETGKYFRIRLDFPYKVKNIV